MSCLLSLRLKKEMANLSEKGYQAILENSSGGIALVDPTGMILYESPGVFGIIGWKPEERVGKSVFEFISPDESAALKIMFGKLISGEEKSISVQAKIKHADGSWKWIVAKGVSALNNPDVKAVIINYWDISDRIIAEEDLVRSYDLLRSIYSKVTDSLFYLGVEPGEIFRYLSVNPAFLKSTGLRSDQVIGKLMGEVTPEPSLSLVLDRLRSVIKNKKSESWIETIDSPNGKKYSEVTIEPIYDTQGICTNLVGTVHDITSIRETAENLARRNKEIQEEKEKDETILNSIAEAIVVVDRTGIIGFMNGVGLKLLGWEAEEVIGKSFREVWNVKDIRGVVVVSGPIQQALSKGIGSSTSSYLYSKKDGTDLPVHVSVSPVIKDGAINGVVAVFHDISREKEIDNTKTEFVSLASHQLRTPLSALNWYSEMLLSGGVDCLGPEKKKYLEEVRRSSRRMVDLVNLLLNVSRIEVGTFSIDPLPTQVIDVAKSVLAELTGLSETRKINIHEILTENLPLLNVDPRLIKIFLHSLLKNAVLYTPEGGMVEIEVKTVKTGEQIAGKAVLIDSLLLRVTDNGYGIPEDQIDKLYMKFFRGDNVRDKDTVGSGLELFVVKSLLDSVGGKIRATSVEGKGSTFYILLPLSGMPQKVGQKILGYYPINKILG